MTALAFQTAPLRRDTSVLAGLALAQTLLFLVPIVVLGAAIGWPGSLRLPAHEVLPLIAQSPRAVQIGYGFYLLVSLALVPLAVALRSHAIARGVSCPLVDAAAALGVAAGLLKMLGIVRWLVAMPELAALHAAAPDAAARIAVETAYVALNAYAGSLGELLGVQLVSGLWLVATGIVLARLGHAWVGPVGIAIGALFAATSLRVAIPGAAALQDVAVPLALLWFPALAVGLVRRL
ncbi:DUF4386 family protein [Salinarimonas sp.]|uniref:DUF4386 family protein n=1 Tax=Salinarimonas sp. TaxID=2766526 RepID=UPI003919CA88